MSARLLVLGIDAANPGLIGEWSAAGRLPNLRALMDRGLTGRVRSVDGFYVGSTWPSLQTGLSPVHHGLHYLVQLEPGTYRYRRMADGELIHGDPFWRRLGQAGLRTAVLDVPLSALRGSVRAAPGNAAGGDLRIVEWGSHDAVYGFVAEPAGLEADVVARFGRHPLVGSCDDIERGADGYEAFIGTLLAGVRQKSALTRHYLRTAERDLFMQVFTEAHCCGHQCWHLHDASHPAHDPSIAARLGDPLERVYSAIDEAIGEILEDAGDATIFVLSAHGMSHAFGAHFLLHEMLYRLGVSARPSVPQPSGLGRTAVSAARRAWRVLPESARSGIRSVRERFSHGGAAVPALRVDAPNSLCFPVHNGLAASGIRLNLIGREPRGRLPERDVDAFCDELSDALLAIVDDETGQPVVRRVLRTSALFEDADRAGPGVLAATRGPGGGLPDLLVEWSDTRKLGSTALAGGAGSRLRIRSPRTGTIEGVNDYGRTGEHRIEGMFIAAGPGIAPAILDSPVSVMDFAPTLTQLLGVEMPDVDGRPIARIMEG